MIFSSKARENWDKDEVRDSASMMEEIAEKFDYDFAEGDSNEHAVAHDYEKLGEPEGTCEVSVYFYLFGNGC